MDFWRNKFFISLAYTVLVGIIYKFLPNEVSKIIGALLTTVFVWIMNKTFSIDYQTKNEKELKEYQKKIDEEIEDYKNEWNKKLEDYKNKLDAELETHKAKLSGYTLVTKLQYDLEFKIYTEIYEKIFLLFIETDKLRPYTPIINKNEDENIKERLNSFLEAYNETLNLLNKYKPFYSKEIYLALKKVQDICYKEFESVRATSFLYFNYLKSNERKKEIQEKLDKISELIRERIENMKIVE